MSCARLATVSVRVLYAEAYQGSDTRSFWNVFFNSLAQQSRQLTGRLS